MKAKELAELLLKHPKKEVVVFAAGELYPVLIVQDFEGKCEIGCGWAVLEDED